MTIVMYGYCSYSLCIVSLLLFIYAVCSTTGIELHKQIVRPTIEYGAEMTTTMAITNKERCITHTVVLNRLLGVLLSHQIPNYSGN